MHLVLSPLGSLFSLFVHPAYLKQRNPQKLCGFFGLSCCSVTLPLMERPAGACAHFTHLPILSVRMLLFWLQTCLVMTRVVICRPAVIVPFTHHSHTGLLFLQTEPVLVYLSAAWNLFVACFFVFSSCGCRGKWASHSQQRIELNFFFFLGRWEAGQGDMLVHLCLLAQNRVVYSPLSFSSFPSFLSLSYFPGRWLKLKESNKPFVLFKSCEMQRKNYHKRFVTDI